MYVFPISCNSQGLGGGEPHLKTLDGYEYTFNGWGEFVMMDSTEFELQGRTSRVVINNVIKNATKFTSLVARQKVPPSTTVELRTGASDTKLGTKIILYFVRVKMSHCITHVMHTVERILKFLDLAKMVRLKEKLPEMSI